MCRVCALPPGTTKEAAMEIMENFYVGNEDGTGSVYVKDGKFVIHKWGLGFETVKKRNLPLFDHMPYPGWTLAHVRAASHGGKTTQNAHPFAKGDWALVHNGIFYDYAPVKAVLSTLTGFDGQTDSEVALAMWNQIGKEKFKKVIGHSGVFMFLKRNGQLKVVCTTGGDLVFQRTKNGILMASELPHEKYKRQNTVLEGEFHLNKSGGMIHEDWEKDIAPIYSRNWGKRWKTIDYSYLWDEEKSDFVETARNRIERVPPPARSRRW